MLAYYTDSKLCTKKGVVTIIDYTGLISYKSSESAQMSDRVEYSEFRGHNNAYLRPEGQLLLRATVFDVT